MGDGWGTPGQKGPQEMQEAHGISGATSLVTQMVKNLLAMQETQV